MKRALFLFNHDAGHQVAHLAGVAAATARLHPSIASTIAYATPPIRQRLETLISADDAANLHWVELSLTGWSGMYSIPVARSFSTATKNPQPAPQYGHVLGRFKSKSIFTG